MFIRPHRECPLLRVVAACGSGYKTMVISPNRSIAPGRFSGKPDSGELVLKGISHTQDEDHHEAFSTHCVAAQGAGVADGECVGGMGE